MDLISVIVPVYKVEEYLDKCISSIVNQTYQNLEIILIDDGSPDRSGEICDAWAEKDGRIRVIHQANVGGAAARNTGLNMARGALIAFVDSDDYIASEIYERLQTVLAETGADVAECGYMSVLDDHGIPAETGGLAKIYTTSDALYANLYNSACQQIIWNKLYKKNAIGNIRFVEGKTIDDEFFTYRVIGCTNRIAVISDRMYFYRQQPDSVMHQKYTINRLDALEACVLRCQYIESKYPELAADARANVLATCMYHYQMILRCLHGPEKAASKKRFKRITGEQNFRLKDIHQSAMSRKLWLYLACINLIALCHVREALRIGH